MISPEEIIRDLCWAFFVLTGGMALLSVLLVLAARLAPFL